MTFVCARCRYRVMCGFPSWDDCRDCSRVGELLKYARYEPPKNREPPPKQLEFEFNSPERIRVLLKEPYAGGRLASHELPRLDYTGDPLQFGKEGRGDPYLVYECFSDFTYSPELRTQMREQVAIEILLMPDDEWWPPYYGKRRKKLKNRKTKTHFR